MKLDILSLAKTAAAARALRRKHGSAKLPIAVFAGEDGWRKAADVASGFSLGDVLGNPYVRNALVGGAAGAVLGGLNEWRKPEEKRRTAPGAWKGFLLGGLAGAGLAGGAQLLNPGAAAGDDAARLAYVNQMLADEAKRSEKGLIGTIVTTAMHPSYSLPAAGVASGLVAKEVYNRRWLFEDLQKGFEKRINELKEAAKRAPPPKKMPIEDAQRILDDIYSTLLRQGGNSDKALELLRAARRNVLHEALGNQYANNKELLQSVANAARDARLNRLKKLKLVSPTGTPSYLSAKSLAARGTLFGLPLAAMTAYDYLFQDLYNPAK